MTTHYPTNRKTHQWKSYYRKIMQKRWIKLGRANYQRHVPRFAKILQATMSRGNWFQCFLMPFWGGMGGDIYHFLWMFSGQRIISYFFLYDEKMLLWIWISSTEDEEKKWRQEQISSELTSPFMTLAHAPN